ncbi:hypothetical protein DRJ17_02340 [Candidatus Woesearchaeota archaeon]|nr:MAG: hypothetical protein DRJ17_02340 [Candidatus Woesearchaeota archaeon]
MTLKLDKKDRMLLALLDENSRYSNTQIAKKIKLSKPAVEYRIKRLEKNGVIFEYYTVIDFTKFGYQQYKIYLKLQDVTLEDEKEIIDFWKRSKNCVWVAEVRSKWDLAVSIIAKSNYEFGRILNEFMNKNSGFILEKDVLLLEYSPLYAREYLMDTEQQEFIYGEMVEKRQIDSVDKKILKELSVNARISIVNLVKKTGLTRDVINYRLKKLKKEGIIVQFRCYPEFNKIGINLYKLILRTKNFNEDAEMKLKQYIRQHKKATQLLKLIGSWDVEIEFETENEDELYDILLNIRKEFSYIIRDYDILRVTKNYKLNFYPF